KPLGACAMKYATAMSPAKMNATGRVNKPSTISTPPTSSIIPLMPESDIGAAPVEGETGKLKYFDVPCSRNSRPTMMRKILSTRGDHVARKLSIAGIIISPMNAPRLCRTPTKRRGRDAIRPHQPHRRSTGQQRDPGSSALTLLPEKILRMRPCTVRGPKDLIPLPRRPSQSIHGSHQRRNSSSVRNRLGGVPPMLIGVLVTLRGARGRPAVHPAAAVRHRWRLASAPAPCPRPTPPAAVH